MRSQPIYWQAHERASDDEHTTLTVVPATRNVPRMNSAVSLIQGHRPRANFSDERVPINIAPEVRKRLNGLLYSDHFMGTGVGFSAFIDRACEAAETEIAQARPRKDFGSHPDPDNVGPAASTQVGMSDDLGQGVAARVAAWQRRRAA